MADLREALLSYAYHAPLDLKRPSQLQRDLVAIAGEPSSPTTQREPSPYAGQCGVLEARLIIIRITAERLLALAERECLTDDDLRKGLKDILETVERPVQ